MKKLLFTLLILSCWLCPVFTQENDIVLSKTENKTETVTRYKHQQNFYGFEKSYAAFENPSTETNIFTLPASNEIQILEIEVQTQSDKESTWYKIQYKNQTGWIQTDFNPYKNGNWEYLGTEIVDEKTFTIRKTTDRLLIKPEKELVYMYEKPSFNATVVASTKEETAVKVLAITEETEKIKWGSRTKTEHWVKILFQEKEVWIFGTYLDSGRGGPKYSIPEKMINWNLEAGGV